MNGMVQKSLVIAMTNLAQYLRPKTLDDYIGQNHLLAKNKPLYQLIHKGLSSCILFGPPGCGKTSLAQVIANNSELKPYFFNATIDNKAKLQQHINEASLFDHAIIIIDECHRLTKPLQDMLLPYIEQEKIIMIGLTTENPNIALTRALRSRCYLFELMPLTHDDLRCALHRVEQATSFFECQQIMIDEPCKETLIYQCNGDIRLLYQMVELALYTVDNHETLHLTLDILKQCQAAFPLAVDKDQNEHYALLSALQKSIRGSDVDSALFYFAILLKANDLQSLCRRLLVIAFEDIGLANPNIMSRAIACVQAVDYLGMPEAKIPLANLVVDLSLSPKSNAALSALQRAEQHLDTYGQGEIPSFIRNHHSNDYQSPHQTKEGWNNQDYWPHHIPKASFYQPKENSRYEKAFKERMDYLNHLKSL